MDGNCREDEGGEEEEEEEEEKEEEEELSTTLSSVLFFMTTSPGSISPFVYASKKVSRSSAVNSLLVKLLLL